MQPVIQDLERALDSLYAARRTLLRVPGSNEVAMWLNAAIDWTERKLQLLTLEQKKCEEGEPKCQSSM